MAITLRHDAAAVGMFSKREANRKYGLDLMAMQQRKYDDQQANTNRLLAANPQQNVRNNWEWDANAPQGARRGRQQAGGIIQQGGQRGFGLTTTVAAQEQQAAEAAEQRKFMEEARKLSTGMIMEDIKNGEFDPATSRKLQQNLVEEAEALGNPQLDATQRAEALQKIRADRAVLSSNRMQKPPTPTPQEEYDQGIVVGEDGTKFRKNSKGEFEPVPVKPAEPQRPTSVDDAIAADPAKLKPYVDQAVTALTANEVPLTPQLLDEARKLARSQYESDLGLGTPTAAPLVTNSVPLNDGGTGRPQEVLEQPAPDMRQERSILEPAAPLVAPPITGEAGMPPIPPGLPPVSPPITGDAGMPPIPPGPTPAGPPAVPGQPQQGGSSTPMPTDDWETAKKMLDQGFKQITATDGNLYWVRDDRPTTAPPASPAAPASQNPWTEAASGGEPTPAPSQGQQPATPAQPTPAAPSGLPQAPEPNFAKMFVNATDDADRSVIGVLQQAWASAKTPEIQNAIGVLANPSAAKRDKLAAFEYLQSSGFDVEQLQMAATRKSKENDNAYTEASYSM